MAVGHVLGNELVVRRLKEFGADHVSRQVVRFLDNGLPLAILVLETEHVTVWGQWPGEHDRVTLRGES